MLSRNWSIVAAIAGLILLAAANKPSSASKAQGSTKQQQATPAPAAAPTVSAQAAYRPYADREADSCYNAKDHDSADLCAQWRSAIATEKAAHEAMRATNWGIFAAILSLATVVGLIITIWQTHGALDEARRGNRISQRANARATRIAISGAEDTARAIGIAEKNAAAAEKLADQAEATAERQLRPYLSISSVIFYNHYAGRDDPQLVISIDNHGQTPATIVYKTIGCSWYVSGDNSEDIFDFKESAMTDCFPKTTIRIPVLMPRGIKNGDESGLMFLIGRIDYHDVFKKEHSLPFQFQTFNRMTYTEIEHGQALVIRAFDYKPNKGGGRQNG